MKLLNYRAVVYVPDRVSDAVEKYTNALTKEAGGVTITEAMGEWYNDRGELERETVWVHEWYSDHQLFLRDLVQAMLEQGEEAVLATTEHCRGVTSLQSRTS